MLVLGSGNETGNSGPYYDVVCIQPRSRAPYPVSGNASWELETRLAVATLQVCDNYCTGAVQQRR